MSQEHRAHLPGQNEPSTQGAIPAASQGTPSQTTRANQEPHEGIARRSAVSDETFTLVPGDTLAQYRILSRLGSGGMGQVFRALDLSLEREVAIKVASEPLAVDVDAMVREARALAALNHPNVVTVYQVDIHQRYAFIAMELLRGKTLRDRMNRAQLSTVEALGIVCDVLRGLCAAHEAGIVHLDLKPENIFLTHDGKVKLLDFGIARHKRTSAYDAHTIVGTISYMAPEQLLGDRLDFRTDLFSLAIVLHELVAGKHPFERPQLAAMMYALASGDYLKDIKVDDEPEIEGIIRACMALDRNARPPSTTFVLEQLEQVRQARSRILVPSPIAYTETEHGNVAFQLLGNTHELDCLLIPGLLGRGDFWINEPEGTTFLQTLAASGRVIFFDRCGFGSSDRVAEASLPTIDEEIEHIDAVLGACSSSRVVLCSIGVGAPLAILYAALRPERVRGLVVYGGAAGYIDAEAQARLGKRADQWGTEKNAGWCAPSFAGDTRLLKWLTTWERMTASPRAARARSALLGRTNARAALPFVSCPTLILRRGDDAFCPPGAMAPFAEELPGATLITVEGRDHFPAAQSGDVAPILTRFMRELSPTAPDPARSLATYVLTDLSLASLPPRFEAEVLLESGPAKLLRVDRPGAAARVVPRVLAGSAGRRAALHVAPLGTSPTDVLAELEPLFSRAPPRMLVASDLARVLVQGTSGFTIDSEAQPDAEGARRRVGQPEFEDVAPLVHKSFSFHADPGPRLRIEGMIMLRDPERQIFPHVLRIHESVIGCGTLVVDVRRLSQINSSALGMFIRWVGLIQAEPEGRRYRLSFLADPQVVWQRSNLMPLAMIAPDVIEVVSNGSK